MQFSVDLINYIFSSATIHKWKTFFTDHINTSRVNMLKNKIDKCMLWATYMYAW